MTIKDIYVIYLIWEDYKIIMNDLLNIINKILQILLVKIFDNWEIYSNYNKV